MTTIVANARQQDMHQSSQPIPIRQRRDDVVPGHPPRLEAVKASNTNSTSMSPVNQNGSYEFDRVILSGTLLKRTRKTKQWKPVYLVLRPNLLSIYKDREETKLRHGVTLSDVTAIARQKDSKKKMEHVFGVFSPARNYRLAATSEKEAQTWLNAIRTEARIDSLEEETVMRSPATNMPDNGFGCSDTDQRLASSSSDTEARPMSSYVTRSARRPSHAVQYSGNEYGSYSDFSDTTGHVGIQGSAISLPQNPADDAAVTSTPQPSVNNKNNPYPSRDLRTTDEDRVIYHGWLYVLKSKNGIRSWKQVWIVLRPRALGLYKNDQEYAANLIIPFSSIIDAVEIDPASKSKQHCMQIISEEKNLRFCANGEEQLARWLGAFKSLLVKRREAESKRVAADAAHVQQQQIQQPPKSSSSAAQATAAAATMYLANEKARAV